VVTRDDGANFYFEVTLRGKERVFSIGHYKMYKLKQEHESRGQNFPTPYSATNLEEHFCEAVALLARGKLPAEHAKPFNDIWN